MTDSAETVTIDGVEYALDTLSDEARNQLAHLRMTDREIAHLEQRLAITRTARTAYARALAEALPRESH